MSTTGYNDLLESLFEGLTKLLSMDDDEIKKLHIDRFLDKIDKIDHPTVTKKKKDVSKINNMVEAVAKGIVYDAYNTTKPTPGGVSENTIKQNNIQSLIDRIDDFIAISHTDFKSANYLNHTGFLNYLSDYYNNDHKPNDELYNEDIVAELTSIYKNTLYRFYMTQNRSVSSISLYTVRQYLVDIYEYYDAIILKEMKIKELIDDTDITIYDELLRCLNSLLNVLIRNKTIRTVKDLNQYMKTINNIELLENVEKNMTIILTYLKYFYPVYREVTDGSLYTFIDGIAMYINQIREI